MDYQSFLLVPRGVSQGKYASEKPKLENIQVMMFKRGSEKIFWRTKHSQEQFLEVKFLQYIKSLGNDFKCSEQSRGVKLQKKKESFQLYVLFSSHLAVSFGKIFQSTMLLLIC